MAEVETTREGGVLTITLNRPDVLNAFNRDMHEALGEALKEARDSEIRAVVLTGAGRGFCVGQDLTEFREAPGDIADRLRASYHPERARDPGAEKTRDRRNNAPLPARGCRSPARAISASLRTRQPSCPPSSTSASSPTRAAPTSSPAFSALPEPSSG